MRQTADKQQPFCALGAGFHVKSAVHRGASTYVNGYDAEDGHSTQDPHSLSVSVMQEMASSLQLVLFNEVAIAAQSRRAVFKAASAYTDTLEPRATDRSVARVSSACRTGQGL